LKGVITGTGAPGENQPAPRSDDPNTGTSDNTNANSQSAKGTSEPSSGQEAAAPQPDPNELKPLSQNDAANSAPDPNELKPNVAPADAPAPAPQQVNELGPNGQPSAQGGGKADPSQDLADDQMISSSKHKKKKGMQKIIPMGK
jgi:hypothetical protein